jgi:hypothetical protein
MLLFYIDKMSNEIELNILIFKIYTNITNKIFLVEGTVTNSYRFNYSYSYCNC